MTKGQPGLTERDKLDRLLDRAPAPGPVSLALMGRLKAAPDSAAPARLDRWMAALSGLRAFFAPRWLIPEALALTLLFFAGVAYAKRSDAFADIQSSPLLALTAGDPLTDGVAQ